MSQITVRRATVKDAAAYARILSQPEVMPQLLQVPFNDEEVWRAKLAETTAPGKADVPLVAEIGGEVVGTAGLHPASMQLRRRHAMHIGIGIAAEYQGRGVGSALMQAMCDYADNWAQVLRLELTVFADNQRAIALYRKFGFEREGLHRAYALRGGEYVDALSMARLHPHPPRIPKPEVTELR
jgi:putative acetyltransferase